MCDNVLPLKGILKSSEARDSLQKVVCFSGPSSEEHLKGKPQLYPTGQQPQFDEDRNFCDKYKDPVSIVTVTKAEQIYI